MRWEEGWGGGRCWWRMGRHGATALTRAPVHGTACSAGAPHETHRPAGRHPPPHTHITQTAGAARTLMDGPSMAKGASSTTLSSGAGSSRSWQGTHGLARIGGGGGGGGGGISIILRISEDEIASASSSVKMHWMDGRRHGGEAAAYGRRGVQHVQVGGWVSPPTGSSHTWPTAHGTPPHLSSLPLTTPPAHPPTHPPTHHVGLDEGALPLRLLLHQLKLLRGGGEQRDVRSRGHCSWWVGGGGWGWWGRWGWWGWWCG